MLFPLSFRCCLFFQDLTVKKLPADTILTEVGRGGGACFLLSQKSRNGTEGNVGSGIDSIYYFFPSSPLPHILGRERGTKTLFFLHTHTGQTWIQGERKGEGNPIPRTLAQRNLQLAPMECKSRTRFFFQTQVLPSCRYQKGRQ